MTVLQELEKVERVVEDVSELEQLEDYVGEDKDALRMVHRLRERRLQEVAAVRISVAASVLGLSEPTVRSWADLGLLEDAASGSNRQVTLKSLLQIRPFVIELRRMGRTRGLFEALVARLDDRRTLNDRRLLASLEQMRAGDLVEITPAD